MRNIFSRILDTKFPHRQPPLKQSKAVSLKGIPTPKVCVATYYFAIFAENYMKTRMHSSRMHTANSSSCRGGGGQGGGWTWSPSIAHLGVGLDLIPLNFPLGRGPGPDPPQFPPWVWALRPPQGAGTPAVNRILDTRLWKYYLAPNFVWGR